MEFISGIDVSAYNGDIDWKRVKESGVRFAMIRAGFGSYADQKDARFEENYKGAKAVGLPVGAYWFSYAADADEASLEARAFLDVIKGKRFEYPVAYDIESRFQAQLSIETVDSIINAFCKHLERERYFVTLYSYDNFLANNVSEATRTQYSVWAADTLGEPTVPYDMWQHSFDGSVDGIQTRTDLNRSRIDFEKLIKSKGFNGFSKDKPEKPYDENKKYLITLKEGTWYYREGPSADDKALGTVSGGYKYSCTKRENGWYYCPPMGGWFGPAAVKAVEVIDD